MISRKGYDGSVWYQPTIQDMIGRVFTRVEWREDSHGDNFLEFEDATGVFSFNHHQDCCENVYIESIVGDLQDLVGVPLLVADESSEDNPASPESGTWTFYKFATSKGYVDVRWLGESNGYYSESVDLDYTSFEPEQVGGK